MGFWHTEALFYFLSLIYMLWFLLCAQGRDGFQIVLLKNLIHQLPFFEVFSFLFRVGGFLFVVDALGSLLLILVLELRNFGAVFAFDLLILLLGVT